ncbi:hypothetical protein ABVK25_002601 [Lepraria finkii]|uniref:Uncharacterized protein n=1 Tax=Lepraria finkii TaxID=1340010 RepID=A0ABR4BGA4_9LECA
MDKPRRGIWSLELVMEMVMERRRERWGRKWEGGRRTAKAEVKEKERIEGEKRKRDSEVEKKTPRARERRGPGEEYQPESWTPGSARR